MRTEKHKAATSAKATAQNYNRQTESYQQCAPKARDNLKEQIGLLLYHLQSPLTQSQRRTGWQLLGVMLLQYVDLKYGRAG